MAAAGSASSGSASFLVVSGSGSGGVNELATKLNPAIVSFGLARVPFGSGTFARDKFVFLHVNSEGCPPIKRGRINTKKGDVRKMLGDVHADLTFSEPSEVSLDSVLGELVKVIAADSTGSFSIAKMKADYEEMIARSTATAAGADAGGVALTRKTAAEMGGIKADAALKAVREPLGAWNWVLFTPEFDFVNAGSLSAPEMLRWLKPDAFYFGLMRLGFGTGRFRRTKWVFFVWSGPAVSIVKRGKAAGARSSMRTKLGTASVDIEATSDDALALPAVIDKVKRAAVVDGDDVHSEGDPYSVDNFMKALEEEAAANGSFFGDSGLVKGGSGGKSAEELIRDVRTSGGSTNWVLFNVAA